jgi:cleavage stimulation factor subunit 2
VWLLLLLRFVPIIIVSIMSSSISGDTSHRSVFVGNIDFSVTEQQLLQLFSTVGRVVAVRLVSDRETGKPRGFGFIEFSDRDTAASAVRNLNNNELNGRSLKVNFADQNMSDQNKSSNNPNASNPAVMSSSSSSSAVSNSNPSHRLGPQPLVRPSTISIGSQSVGNPYSNPNSQYGPSEIVTLLKTLTREQLLEILAEMKRFCVQNPEGAKQLLLDTPQLAHSLLQIELLFGLISTQDIQAMEAATRQSFSSNIQPQNTNVPANAALPLPPPQQQQPIYAQPQSFLPQPQPSVLSHLAPLPQPQSGPFYSAPANFGGNQPILPPGAPEPEFLSKLPAAEAAVLREILRLTPEQIKTMPQHVQQQVFQILNQMGMAR